MSDAQKKTHLVGLDLLRFLAAILVSMLHLIGSYQTDIQNRDTFVGHLAALFRLAPEPPIFSGPVAALAFTGFIGVQIFFVISGFVIAYSASTATFSGFVVSRFLRLWPALLICTSISAAILLLTGYMSAPEAAASFARSVVFSPVGPYIDPVVWTLVIEVIFYALVALTLLLFGAQRIPTLALLIAMASLLHNSIVYTNGCDVYGSSAAICSIVDGHLFSKLAGLALLKHGGLFATGVAIWQIWQRGPSLVPISTLIFAIPASMLQIDVSVVFEYAHYADFGAVPNSLLANAIWLFVVGIVAVSAITAEWIHNRLGARGLAVTRALGLATYPFYLLHSVVGVFTLSLFSTVLPPQLSAVVGIALALGLSIVVALVAEPWLRKQLRRFVVLRPATS